MESNADQKCQNKKNGRQIVQFEDLYLSHSSFMKIRYLKMESWAFDFCENTKSFSAQGKFVGQHIRMFASDLVELTSTGGLWNYAVANLRKVVPRTKQFYELV